MEKTKRERRREAHEKREAFKKQRLESGEAKPAKQHHGQHNFVRDESTDKPDFFLFHGKRHVFPYPFDYLAWAKQKWFGRELIEVFNAEFVHYSKEYYEQAILSGRITVNGKEIPTDYRIKDGDQIAHRSHRHELPVSGEGIVIAHEDEHIVVVSKPASMPVHPCGRYRHNSLTYILHRHFGHEVHPIHRLDRHTSGLVLLAKTQQMAARLSQELVSKKFHKVYLARVKGEFPAAEPGTEVAPSLEPAAFLVDQPIAIIDPKLGKYDVREDGKPSQTRFRRLHYNGHSSLVECSPLTGRTHQIRVHLRWLGFPIMNDPCYGGQCYFSNSVVSAQLLEELPSQVSTSSSASSSSSSSSSSSFASPSSSSPSSSSPSSSSPSSSASSTSSLSSPAISSNGSTPLSQAQSIVTPSDPELNRSQILDLISLMQSTSTEQKKEETQQQQQQPQGQEKGERGAGGEEKGEGEAAGGGEEKETKSASPLPSWISAEKAAAWAMPGCSQCSMGGYFKDPRPYCDFIWLHALRYEGPDWTYQVPSPSWADERFDSVAACSAPVNVSLDDVSFLG